MLNLEDLTIPEQELVRKAYSEYRFNDVTSFEEAISNENILLGVLLQYGCRQEVLADNGLSEQERKFYPLTDYKSAEEFNTAIVQEATEKAVLTSILISKLFPGK